MPEGTAPTVSGRILHDLRDDNEQIWGCDTMTRDIQEGYNDLVRACQLLWVRVALNNATDTALYTLPSTFIEMERVTNNDRLLPPANRIETRRTLPRYESQTGTPYTWMVESINGVPTLRKIPIPGASDVDVFFIEYYSRGGTLNPQCCNSDFQIPLRYIRLVRYFAMSRLLSRRGDGQNLRLSRYWMQRYEEGKAALISRLEHRALELMRRMRPIREKNLSRPSPYPWGSRLPGQP